VTPLPVHQPPVSPVQTPETNDGNEFDLFDDEGPDSDCVSIVASDFYESDPSDESTSSKDILSDGWFSSDSEDEAPLPSRSDSVRTFDQLCATSAENQETRKP
jgi:hypothetical protein